LKIYNKLTHYLVIIKHFVPMPTKVGTTTRIKLYQLSPWLSVLGYCVDQFKKM